MVSLRRPFLPLFASFAVVALVVPVTTRGAAAVAETRAVEAPRGFARVTIYTANWCSFCKALEKSLGERGVPFDAIDVDQHPDEYGVAKRAAGANGIPLTSVVRMGDVRWIIGNQPDAVEKAYNGD